MLHEYKKNIGKHQMHDFKSHLQNLKTLVTQVFSTLLTISWPKVVKGVSRVGVDSQQIKKVLKYFSPWTRPEPFKKKEEIKKRSSFEALIWSGCDWNTHARQVVCVALSIVFARWRHFHSQTKCRNNSTCQLVRRSYCLLIQQKHSPALLSSNLEVLLWQALKIDDNAQIDDVLNDGWH